MKIQTPRLRGRKGRGSGDGQGADLFKASPPWTGRNTHTHTHTPLSHSLVQSSLSLGTVKPERDLGLFCSLPGLGEGLTHSKGELFLSVSG